MGQPFVCVHTSLGSSSDEIYSGDKHSVFAKADIAHDWIFWLSCDRFRCLPMLFEAAHSLLDDLRGN